VLEIFLILLASFVLVVIGVPVAFAFFLGSFTLLAIFGLDAVFSVAAGFKVAQAYTLLAIPFFILAGMLMGSAGIAERLINWVNSLIGHVRGGLEAVLVVTCTVFGAISGSSSSAIAAIGTIMIPQMVKRGYPRGYVTGLMACSCILALLIPPSVTMIVFAVMAMIPVTAAFLSTLIPGLLITISYYIVNFWLCRRMPTIQVEPKTSFVVRSKVVAQTTGKGFFALLMPLIILGGIYTGMFTPTEAAAVAAIYTLPVGLFIYCGFTVRNITRSVVDAASVTGSIMLVLFSLFIMGRIMVLEGVPHVLSEFFLGISDNKFVFLAMLNVFLLLLGMIMDDISAHMLVAIVLMPVALNFGVDPYHFAAIVGVNVGLGNVAPPVAPMLYLAGRVAGNLPLGEYIRPASYFMIFGHLPVIILVTYIPGLSTTLPYLVL
jgi:tripartite ATP-independent transporter DctM subunit